MLNYLSGPKWTHENEKTMNELIDYIQHDITLSDELQKRFKDIIVEKRLVKGQKLLHEDSHKKEHNFVASGCLRSFYKTDNGKEHTLQFAVKNWWINDYMTFYTDRKSVVTIESLSHSKILVIGKENLERIYQEYPQFATLHRRNFEKRIATLQKRILSLLALTAAEKYDQFVNDYAVFEKLIPNFQIASYLGITPESLSRIRKERVLH